MYTRNSRHLCNSIAARSHSRVTADVQVWCASSLLAVLSLVLCCLVPVRARTVTADATSHLASSSSGCSGQDITSTPHNLELRDRTLHYVAHAGFLPIRNEFTGIRLACIFFVAYTLPPDPHGPPRPVTFLWNGGPGANSAPLQFEAFGPVRFSKLGGPTSTAKPQMRLVPNAETLLDQSNLVFIDPVGTGFSRPARASYGTEFYSVHGDIRATAEFIREYRIRFNVWNAPIFLIGESYGVWRAAGVAAFLLRHGYPIDGLVLLSGGIPVGQTLPILEKFALFVPDMTAAAFYYKKLSRGLEVNLHAAIKASANWAQHVYAPALSNASHLSALQRTDIVRQLSRLTGIPADAIDTNTLVIAREQFTTELLAGSGRRLDMFDSRNTAPQPGAGQRIRLILQDLHERLRVDDDLPYLGLGFGDPGETGYTNETGYGPKWINENWNYNQKKSSINSAAGDSDGTTTLTLKAAEKYVDYGPPGGHPPWLNTALSLNPHLRVFVGTGLFDTLNSCLGERLLVHGLPTRMRSNISVHCYDSGHMIYLDRSASQKLRENLRDFYIRTLERNR